VGRMVDGRPAVKPPETAGSIATRTVYLGLGGSELCHRHPWIMFSFALSIYNSSNMVSNNGIVPCHMSITLALAPSAARRSPTFPRLTQR